MVLLNLTLLKASRKFSLLYFRPYKKTLFIRSFGTHHENLFDFFSAILDFFLHAINNNNTDKIYIASSESEIVAHFKLITKDELADINKSIENPERAALTHDITGSVMSVNPVHHTFSHLTQEELEKKITLTISNYTKQQFVFKHLDRNASSLYENINERPSDANGNVIEDAIILNNVPPLEPVDLDSQAAVMTNVEIEPSLDTLLQVLQDLNILEVIYTYKAFYVCNQHHTYDMLVFFGAPYEALFGNESMTLQKLFLAKLFGSDNPEAIIRFLNTLIVKYLPDNITDPDDASVIDYTLITITRSDVTGILSLERDADLALYRFIQDKLLKINFQEPQSDSDQEDVDLE